MHGIADKLHNDQHSSTIKSIIVGLIAMTFGRELENMSSFWVKVGEILPNKINGVVHTELLKKNHGRRF